MNKTIKLYDNDAYAVSFTGRILSAEETKQGWKVILDRTMFFPEEGGQSCDAGTLAGIPVTDVHIRDGVITHTLAAAEHAQEVLCEGAEVSGEVDWERRFSNMQNHSGEHIVSGILHNQYGFVNKGFHLSLNSPVTIDVDGTLDDAQLLKLERDANAAVYRNVRITAEYPPREVLERTQYRSKIEIDGPVRLVTVEGIDICACCAPHVKSAGEIGLIRILSAEKTGEGMRIYLLCGERALHDLEKKENALREISHLTSKKPEEADEGVRHLVEENARLRAEFTQLQMDWIGLKASQIPASLKSVLLFEKGLGGKAGRELINLLTAAHEGLCAVFSGNDDTEYHFIIGSGSGGISARDAGDALRDNLSAKGGGSPQMVQGTVRAGAEEIKKTLKEWFSDLPA